MAIFLAYIMLLSTAANLIVEINSNTYATASTEKALKSAKAKMYYRSLYYCIGGDQLTSFNNIDFLAGGFNIAALSTKQIALDNWFGGSRNTHAGAYIEADVDGTSTTSNDGSVTMTGHYGDGWDGTFYCGMDDQLAGTAVEAFNAASDHNITTWDLACGREGKNEKGVFDTQTTVTCREVLEKSKTDGDQIVTGSGFLGFGQKGALKVSDSRQENLTKIVKDVIGSSPNQFTDLEMYYVYLLNFQSGCTTQGNDSEAAGGEYEVISWKNGKKETIKLNKTDETEIGLFQSMTEDYFAYPGASGDLKKGKVACSSLASALNDENNKYTKAFLLAAKTDEESGETPVNPGDEETGNDTTDYGEKNDENDKCKGVSGLSWLLCPIIEMVGDATEWLYEEAVEPFLKVEPELMDRDPDGVYGAWQKFQGFANIALVIFMLIIIFSQLTGFGIDNYGIKKTLPKLIVAAILINMSFIICQLCVDVSNILGKTFKDMFEGMIEITPVSETGTAGAVIAEATTVAVVTAGVTALTGGAIWASALSAIVAALPSIVAGLISALISVFFFFLILGVRQAGVIILVAISPLAFVSYMLPNTKKYFDKWKKTFEALLLVYPICGLLMGGGAYAGSIIINSSQDSDHSFIYGLVGLLVSVCPFFLIPTIVKNSMQGLGNIGNRLSNFGKRVGLRTGNFAAKRLSESAGYQTLRSRSLNRANKAWASRSRSKLNEAALKKFGMDFAKLNEEQRKQLLGGKFGAEINARRGAKASGENQKRQEELASAAYANDLATVTGRENKAWANASANASADALWSKDFLQIGEKKFATNEDGKLVNVEDANEIIDPAEFGLKAGEAMDAAELGRKMREAFGEDGMKEKFGSAYPMMSQESFSSAWQKQQANQRARQLGEAAAQAGEPGLFNNSLVAGFTTAKGNINELKDWSSEFLEGIDKGGNTYLKGKDGKYHFKDETLTDKEVEEAESNGKVVKYARRSQNDQFRDANGNALPDSVGSNTTNALSKDKNRLDTIGGGRIETRSQIEQKKQNIARLSNMYGNAAYAGEDGSVLAQAAAAQSMFEGTQKIKQMKQWRNKVLSEIDIDNGAGGTNTFRFNNADGKWYNGDTEAAGADLDKINNALSGKGKNKISANGREWTLDPKTNTYKLADGTEASKEDQTAIDNELAKIPSVRHFTRNANGVFKDDFGNTVDDIKQSELERLTRNNPKFAQSYADLKTIEADKGISSQLGSLVGGAAAQTSSVIAGAAQGIATNTATSQLNSTLGQAAALQDLQGKGYYTATTQMAAAQASGDQILQTAGANVGAIKRQGEAGLTKTQVILQQEEKADIMVQAKKGTAALEAIINDANASENKKKFAQALLDSGNYNNPSAATSATIKSDLDYIESVFDGGMAAALDAKQKGHLVHEAKNGTLDSIINDTSGTYSFAEKYAARKLKDSGTDFSKVGSSAIYDQIKEPIGKQTVPGVPDQVGVVGRTDAQIASNISTASVANLDKFITNVAHDNVGEVKIDMDVAARNAQNEYNLKEAKNNIDITPNITKEYAKALEYQRYDTAQRHIAMEGFRNQTRTAVVSEIRDSFMNPSNIHYGDYNYAMAGIDDIEMKGGFQQIFDLMVDLGKSSAPASVKKVLQQRMASSKIPEVKVYGKFCAGVQDLIDNGTLPNNTVVPSIEQWVDGSYDPAILAHFAGSEKQSLQAYIDDNDANALVGSDKDSIAIMSDLYSKGKINVSPKAAINGAINTRDNDTRRECEKFIKKMNLTDADRVAIFTDMSNRNIGHMQKTTLCSILGVSDLNGPIPSNLTSVFSGWRRAIEKSPNSSAFENMDGEVRSFILKAPLPPPTP